jgi:hypothetical protein
MLEKINNLEISLNHYSITIKSLDLLVKLNMELNSLLFPAPSIEYTAQDLEGEIAYIPRYFKYNDEYIKLKETMCQQSELFKQETRERITTERRQATERLMPTIVDRNFVSANSHVNYESKPSKDESSMASLGREFTTL